jgi:hypothetical protein
MDAAGDGAIETGAGASGSRRDATPAGERAEAAAVLRILTPLLKLRACRDNIRAATAAMEIRGGNGYIEEWVNARLVRDAHIGVLWEGTSNIVALDVVTRAVAKENAHRALQRSLHRMLEWGSPPAPELVAAARASLDRAVDGVTRASAEGASETKARRAASALYHAASAALFLWEGARLGGEAGARRVLLADLVLRWRLAARDPLADDGDSSADESAAATLLV